MHRDVHYIIAYIILKFIHHLTMMFILQVVGDGSAVKKAIEIISSRLRESLLRDRNSFRGRLHSPERFFPPEDDLTYMSSVPFRSALDGPASGPRSSAGLDNVRGNAFVSRPGFAFESAATSMADHSQSFGEDIVFRILCPNDKVESIMRESDGLIEMLRGDVGVDVSVSDPVPGSAERIIIIFSDEVVGQLFLSLLIFFIPYLFFLFFFILLLFYWYDC